MWNLILCWLKKNSFSAALDVGTKGSLNGHVGASYGLGYSVLSIPYYKVEVGNTIQKYIWKLRKVSKKKKTYSVGNQKFSMKRKYMLEGRS